MRHERGELVFDNKGDVSNDGYIVGGKNKERYVLYTWKKGADGKITYFENENTTVLRLVLRRPRSGRLEG